MVICVLVTFEIRKEVCTMDELLDVFAKRAKAAEDDEPGMLAYCAMTREDKPTHVMVYERYADQAAIDAHARHPSHAQLNKELGKLNFTKRRVGMASFVERAGFPFGAKPFGDPQSLLVTFFTMASKKVTGKQILADFAKSDGLRITTESEPGTVSYVAGVLSGVQRGEPKYEKGSFCVAEAYTDKAAFAKHLKRVMPKADPDKAGFAFWKPTKFGFLARPAAAKL